MAPLNRGQRLLESAVRYALAEAALVTPRLLARPTPCPGWDLGTLLAHLCDSVAGLHEAVLCEVVPPGVVPHQAVPNGEVPHAEVPHGDVPHGEVHAAGPGAAAPAGHPGAGGDMVARLRRQAAGLLACCAAGPAGRLVGIGDRRLTAGMVAAAGAIEITVHGWDISVSCGTRRPVPPGLAAVLLPVAAVLITPGTRPGLFAGPVRLPATAHAGDQLVAFTGRRPASWPAAPGPGGA